MQHWELHAILQPGQVCVCVLLLIAGGSGRKDYPDVFMILCSCYIDSFSAWEHMGRMRTFYKSFLMNSASTAQCTVCLNNLTGTLLRFVLRALVFNVRRGDILSFFSFAFWDICIHLHIFFFFFFFRIVLTLLSSIWWTQKKIAVLRSCSFISQETEESL